MAKVIERRGHSIDAEGLIHYDEKPSTYEEAERIAGKRLDRRKNYAIINDEVCEAAEWSQACSGCYEGYSPYDSKGSGCRECGYTGRSHQSHWIPVCDAMEEQE